MSESRSFLANMVSIIAPISESIGIVANAIRSAIASDLPSLACC
jgi:hypothetical protein